MVEKRDKGSGEFTVHRKARRDDKGSE